MAEKDELFKTTWKGGYDKDDVQQAYQTLVDDVYEEQHNFRGNIEKMERAIKEKKAEIERLTERAEKCDAELLSLRGDVRDNYQTYIDNYDAIGSQIYESRVYADRIQKETEAEREEIIREAMDEAKGTRDKALKDAGEIRDRAKRDAEQMLADARAKSERQADIGKKQYEAVQQELHAVLGDFARVQRKFMTAFKSINDVLDDESGDVARMRLEVLREESPTVRMPDVSSLFPEEGAAKTEALQEAVETAPTKDLSQMREELKETEA